MRRTLLLLLITLIPIPAAAQTKSADDSAEQVKNAMSAAPASISDRATVMDHHGKVLRQGDNGWVCMSDHPSTPNNSPMCLDKPWLEFMDAFMNKRTPRFSGLGIGYMLQADFPVSNTDPFATAPTADNEWVANAGPHIMLIVSDASQLEGITSKPDNGGPWVMWKGTPYAHVMVPAPTAK